MWVTRTAGYPKRSFGKLRVEDVFAHSSNIGTYKMAKVVGSDDFLAYAWRFGFGQNTGIG